MFNTKEQAIDFIYDVLIFKIDRIYNDNKCKDMINHIHCSYNIIKEYLSHNIITYDDDGLNNIRLFETMENHISFKYSKYDTYWEIGTKDLSELLSK